MSQPLIVCCSPEFARGLQQVGPELTGDGAEWAFYDDHPAWSLEKAVRRPNVGMIRACLAAVLRAQRGRARLLITLDPRTACWCALFCRLLGVDVDHYVGSFNFPALPGPVQQRFMRFALRQVREFAVHSSMERGLYSRHFDIPEDRIRLRLWRIGVPEISPAQPLQQGRYISALGGNGRDYRTLIQACRLLGDVPFVVVVRPENLAGLEIPPNVRVMVNVPFRQAMNILRYSALTMLPLAGSEVPCGHVTLVCAMHLARAVVTTASAGISDYVIPGFNGLLCEPSSAESMAEAMLRLWNEPEEAERLGENNFRFGAENCSEDRMRSDLAEVLAARGIPLHSAAPISLV